MKAKTSIINAFLDSVAWEAIKQKWAEIKRIESFDVNFGQHAHYCGANVKS